MQISQEQHDQLIELIEDTIGYFCDENMVSGELAYSIMECLATAKVAEMQGIITEDFCMDA
jgi:hypothetical protein|tara:strand:+ start:1078 stop:1260 length:183 start_codon:yes stop_codon:yes gene_type:complete